MIMPTTPSPVSLTARHDLLLADDASCAELLLVPVREALAAGRQVVLAVTATTADALRDALGDLPALHVGPAPQPSTRPAALLADLRVLAGQLDTGPGVQLVDQVPALPASRWWAWSRLEAAYNLLLPGVWHTCVHDPAHLDAARERDLRATHPTAHGVASATYADPRTFLRDRLADPWDAGLPTPWASLADPDEQQVRDLVGAFATSTDLGHDDVADLVFAAVEVTANARRHGLAPVRVDVWGGADRLTVAVHEAGPGVGDPLAGLVSGEGGVGTGLWLVHCTVDVRHVRHDAGSTVELRVGSA